MDIGQSQNFREQPSYNTEYYDFSELQLDHCYSKNDGGAINIRNVKNMKIGPGSSNDSRITDSHA